MAKPKSNPLPPKEGVIDLKSPNQARVIRAHDGLEVGDIVTKNESTIKMMVEKGYWEYVRKDK